MIDLYTAKTPNGWKISIFLEETGLPYTVKPVDLSAGEQHKPEFVVISPNGRIPAIVDHEAAGSPLAIFESAAILIYLAEKTGQFLAASGRARYDALAWLSWQIAGLGPMFGQLGFFLHQKERNDGAIARYAAESGRLLRVLESRLAQAPFLAGDDYTIADMATYAWVAPAQPYFGETLIVSGPDAPATARWLAALSARPAVARGMAIPE